MALGIAYSAVIVDANGQETKGNTIQFEDSVLQPQPASNPVTSGALSTKTFTSTTGAQVSATQQVTLYIVVTGDATNNVGTCVVALSPDNTTYSTVQTISLAAAVNNLGAIGLPVTLVVPLGWYVKFTTTHTTLGTATYA